MENDTLFIRQLKILLHKTNITVNSRLKNHRYIRVLHIDLEYFYEYVYLMK